MHVVFAHDQPLPVTTYGGIERIIYWLMRSLRHKGHKVTLIGHPSSQVEQHGIRLIAGNHETWPNLIPEDADIVNLFFPWHQELSKPYICSIGGNGKPGEVFPQNTIFVSKSHAENHGAECFVYNGIDIEEYPSTLITNRNFDGAWKRFAFLAKASWKVKNLKDCVRAVKAAGKELHIGGGHAWTLSRKIHSYGMVNQQQKLKILSQSDALLWPVRWPEPFGIAMIEAMAAGLPVIASTHGSSKEIVIADVGVTCNHYNEFESVVANAPRHFNAHRIREYALEKFNADKMTDNYLKCYETVLNGHKLNLKQPVAQFVQKPETLLPF